MHQQSLKPPASQHALLLFSRRRASRDQVIASCMHASLEVRAGSGVSILLHACIGVHACKCVSVHAGSEAEPCWADGEFDGTVEHQPSHSASAAGGAPASPQKPQPAPTGPGGPKPAAHAAELSGWLG